MPEERVFALLEADGVDDGFSLHAFQARFDHGPLRGVDHHRHAGDIGLARNQAQKPRHGRLRIEHALVHVDVDDLRTVRNLLARDIDGGRIVAGLDQLAKLRGPRDVGALAHIDEQAVAVDGQRLQAGEAAGAGDGRHDTGRRIGNRACDGTDVIGRGAAATPDHVDETAHREIAQGFSGLCRRLIVFAECVRQSCVRVGAHMRVRYSRQFFDVGSQLLAAERAVESDDRRARMPYRIPKRLGGLARQGASRRIGDRSRDDDRQIDAGAVQDFAYCEQGRLGIQRVENGFDQYGVDAAVDQRARRFGIPGHQLIECNVAKARIVHVGGQ